MGDSRGNDSQKMFLLEVLVDNLFISHSSLNLDRRLMANLTDTCIMFQFLHYPPMVVCESDFIGFPTSQLDTNHITFQSGRSCFFSLRAPQGPVLPVPLEIKVNVVRKLKEGVLPNRLEVGKTSIDMGDSFTELLSTDTDENCVKLPLSKSKKGTFDLKDESGRTVGSLTAFIRLSCFGKLIITQFSLSKEDEKSYLFKGTHAKQICEDIGISGSVSKGKSFCGVTDLNKEKEGFKGSVSKEKSFCGVTGLNKEKELLLSNRPAPDVSNVKMFDQMKKQELVQMDPCQCYMAKNGFPRFPAPTPYPSSVPATTTYPSSFPASTPYPPSFPYPPQPVGRSNLCNCPYPVPPSVMSKYTQRTERDLSLAPGEVGLQNDQVIFQLPLKKPGDPLTDRDKKIDSTVYYKLTSAEETREGQEKNTIHIKSDDLPGMAKKGAVGPVSGLPVDDGHDVFLLKIGKKCDGDKKRNLELELRTPKMKEPKPPMTDQDTQYSEADIPSDTINSGGKAAGGKGKKGKKDKKGKK